MTTNNFISTAGTDSVITENIFSDTDSFFRSIETSERFADSSSYSNLSNTATKTFLTIPGNGPSVIEPLLLKRNTYDWLVGIILLCFILITFFRFYQKKFFRNIIRAILAQPLFNQMQRDGFLFITKIRFPLFLLTILSFSVLIFLILRSKILSPSGAEINEIHFYLKILIGTYGFVYLKYLIIKITGFIFNTRNFTDEYLGNTFIFNALAGMLILPFLLISVYSASAFILIIAFCIFILLSVFKLIRATLIPMKNRKFSGYQIFLYFCTLEILPLIVVIKIIIIQRHLF